MNLHWRYFLPKSSANGPGNRCVLWLQGCSIGCEGCCNPALQNSNEGNWNSVRSIFIKIEAAAESVDGITISGGEPFQQADALYDLLLKINRRTSLSVLVYSGYEKETLLSEPQYRKCLHLIDAVICGPYKSHLLARDGQFCSSENQQVWLLSDRFEMKQFSNLPLLEFFINENGEMIQSGPGRMDLNICQALL